MEAPNTRQVGGNHYAKGGDFQHWDLITNNDIGYLEGCATKYISRWRGKNGVEDLRKALHYVEKLLEVHRKFGRPPLGYAPAEDLDRFFASYPMGGLEQECIAILCRDWDDLNLIYAMGCLVTLISENEAPVGNVQDSPA